MTALRHQILSLIASGELPADGRLPTERALAGRFGTGRRALRLALDHLEAEGLVWRRQGKGTFAGQPSDPTGALAARIAGDTDAMQVMEARLCIEPELAALCTERATATEIERMQALAQRRYETTDPQGIELWDAALHRLIARSARNRPLLTAFALLEEIRSTPEWVAIRARARSPASMVVTAHEHRTILDAIAARQPEAARATMRAHLQTRFTALRGEYLDAAHRSGG